MTYATLRTLAYLSVAALLCAVARPVGAETIGEVEIRPVTLLDATARQKLAALVKDDPDASALYREVETQALARLGREPSPVRVMHYEGLVNTDPRRIETVKHLADMDDVAALIEWWQASGDERAATQGAKYLAAWAKFYQPTGNDVNENKLVPLIVAAGAWRDRLGADDRVAVDAWLLALAEKHREESRNATDKLTNRHAKRLNLIALLANVLDKPEWIREVRGEYETFVEQALFADGTSTDLQRRDTLTYHCSVLRSLMELAMKLSDGKTDLYRFTGASGGSVRKSVEYVIPYADGSKTREEWKNSKVDLDRRRAAAGLEKYQPGRLFDPVDALEMLEQASYYDPELLPLVAKLSKAKSTTFPTWRTVVLSAMRQATR